MEFEELTQQVIGCAMKVHSALGPGFLESVYENALAYELTMAGIGFQIRQPVRVTYGAICVGDFIADMIAEDSVLIENKAVLNLAAVHEAQLVNYLTATGIEVGLLLNFGSERLQFRRKHRTYHPKRS